MAIFNALSGTYRTVLNQNIVVNHDEQISVASTHPAKGESTHFSHNHGSNTGKDTLSVQRASLSFSQHRKGNIIALSPEPEVEKLKHRLDVETVQVSEAV